MAKPTRDEVRTLGLPAPAAVLQPQLVERVDITGGLIFLNHGCSDGDLVELQLVRDTTPGASEPYLPIGLEEGIAYEAEPVTAGSLRLRLSGTAITSFAGEGEGRFNIVADPDPSLDKAIDDAWAIIQAQLTAHGGDVDAPIVSIAARYLAAVTWVRMMAAGDPAKAESYAGLQATYTEEIRPLLAAYFRGIPVRGATDATPTVSEGSPRVVRLGPAAPTWGTSGSGVV